MVVAQRLLTSIAFRRAEISQAWPSQSACTKLETTTIINHGLINVPRRASWRARIRGGSQEHRHQPRTPQSWLITSQSLHSFFTCRTLTRLGDGLLRESLNHNWLVARGVDELVVNELYRCILSREQHDLIRNGRGIRERGYVLASTSEIQHNVLAVRTTKLRLALLANYDEVGFGVLQEHLSGLPRHAGMDTAAKTLVRAADHDQCLLTLALDRLGLGLFENGVGSQAVRSCVAHGLLSAGQLCGSDNFHRLGDFLDVANRLELSLNLAQGGIGGSIGSIESGGPIET